jgi:hypothetical protein
MFESSADFQYDSARQERPQMQQCKSEKGSGTQALVSKLQQNNTTSAATTDLNLNEPNTTSANAVMIKKRASNRAARFGASVQTLDSGSTIQQQQEVKKMSNSLKELMETAATEIAMRDEPIKCYNIIKQLPRSVAVLSLRLQPHNKRLPLPDKIAQRYGVPTDTTPAQLFRGITEKTGWQIAGTGVDQQGYQLQQLVQDCDGKRVLETIEEIHRMPNQPYYIWPSTLAMAGKIYDLAALFEYYNFKLAAPREAVVSSYHSSDSEQGSNYASEEDDAFFGDGADFTPEGSDFGCDD